MKYLYWLNTTRIASVQACIVSVQDILYIEDLKYLETFLQRFCTQINILIFKRTCEIFEFMLLRDIVRWILKLLMQNSNWIVH